MKYQLIMLVIVGVLLINLASAITPYYVKDPATCPINDQSQFPGQSCTPINICGYITSVGDIAQCYDTSTISIPTTLVASYQTQVVNQSGYVLDCYAETTCLNKWYCAIDSTCNTNHKYTNCSSTTATTCGGCQSGWNDCDANPADCEIQNGSACTVGTLAGTYSGCTCVVTPQHFITGIDAQGSTTLPLLWGTQFGTGILANLTNASSKAFLIDAAGCIIFPDGTKQCSSNADNLWNSTNGIIHQKDFANNVSIGTSTPYTSAYFRTPNFYVNGTGIFSAELNAEDYIDLGGFGIYLPYYFGNTIYEPSGLAFDLIVSSNFGTTLYEGVVSPSSLVNQRALMDFQNGSLAGDATNFISSMDFYSSNLSEAVFIEAGRNIYTGANITKVVGLNIEDISSQAFTDAGGWVGASYSIFSAGGNVNFGNVGNFSINNGSNTSLLCLNEVCYSNLAGGNASWNQSYANSLYIATGNTSIYNGLIQNASYLSTYNETYVKWAYNQTQTIWNKSGTNVFPASLTDNVGIGTNNPTTALDINGTLTLRKNNTELSLFIASVASEIMPKIHFRETATGDDWYIQDDGDNLYFSEESTSNYRVTFEKGGSVGINMINPTTVFNVNGTFSVINNSGYQGLYQTATGLVGIGTAAPLKDLHISNINATVKIQSSSTTAGTEARVGFETSTDTRDLYSGGISVDRNNDMNFWTYDGSAGFTWDSDLAKRMVINQSGSVGIGTTTPSQKLEVAGNINMSGSGNKIMVGKGYMFWNTTTDSLDLVVT